LASNSAGPSAKQTITVLTALAIVLIKILVKTNPTMNPSLTSYERFQVCEITSFENKEKLGEKKLT